MKTWQKIKQIRKYLNSISQEKFKDLTKEERSELLKLRRAERLYTYQYDFYLFCIEVLKVESWGASPVKWSKVHRDLCRFLRSTRNLRKNAFIQLPRYHLKTQICTICWRIWRITNEPNLCSLIVSGTLELSKGTARAIRSELQTNENLRSLYPNVLPDWLFNERQNKWSETQFNVARTANYPQCTIEAVGVEATVTGKHFREITMDDLVTPENATTPEQCSKIIQAYKYFLSIADPKHGQFVVVGTPYTDSDLYSFIKQPEVIQHFRVFIRPVFDSQGEPIWPELFTKEKLQEIAVTQGSYTFSTQYLLDPVPESEMEFKKSWLRFYTSLPRDLNGNEIPLTKYTVVDPITAKSTSSTSKDRGVILIVGVDTASNWYVLDYKLYSRATESEMFEGIFSLCEKHNSKLVGWESVAYQLQGKHNLEEELKRTGREIKVKELRPGHTKKDVRIRSLIPYFERGQILLRPTHGELIMELQRFPHGETVDILDCLAYMLQMIPAKRPSMGLWKSKMSSARKAYYS